MHPDVLATENVTQSQNVIVLFAPVVYDTATGTYITKKTIKYSSSNPYTAGDPTFEDVSFDPGNETVDYVIQLHLFVSDVEGAQVRFNIGNVTVSKSLVYTYRQCHVFVSDTFDPFDIMYKQRNSIFQLNPFLNGT